MQRRVVRLYPAAFRDRWGPALVEDVAAAGWRAWPNLLAGIADMWLHPAIWPADSRAQRRGRTATLAITAAVFAALFGRAAEAQGIALASAPGGRWTAPACAALFLLGLVLVAPLPRPSRAAATALACRTIRRLAAPVALGVGMVVLARRHADAVVAGPWHHLAIGCYWTVLVLGAVQACRIFTGLGPDILIAPRPGRLRAGLWSLVAASVLGGSMVLATVVARRDLNPVPFASGAALVLLAWALTTNLRDLRSVVVD